MKVVLVDKGLRVLLVASLLMATTLSRASVFHAHAAGAVPHQHDDHHHADGCHLGADLAPAGPAVEPIGEPHQHVYLGFLPVGLSLPSPEGPSKSPGQQGGDSSLVFAPAGPRYCVCHTVALQCAWFALAVGESPGGLLWTASRPSAAGVAPVPYLCDRARHERSGVLLA